MRAIGELLDDVCVVLRQAIDEAGGHEIEARADEFFAVFDAPRPAVDAAIAVQLALRDRDDRPRGRRCGCGSGSTAATRPRPTDNYIGMDVNTASRICAVGHGGQIVVSDNTRESVKATAPAGVRFIALGTHRLRGLPDSGAAVPGRGEGPGDPFPAIAHNRPSVASRGVCVLLDHSLARRLPGRCTRMNRRSPSSTSAKRPSATRSSCQGGMHRISGRSLRTAAGRIEVDLEPRSLPAQAKFPHQPPSGFRLQSGLAR